MRVEQKKFGIPIRKYYFTDAPQAGWHDLILPTAYMDSYSVTKPRFFCTEYRHTLLTDLTPDEQDIFSNFPKDTRNQIRRCEQDQHFSLNLQTSLEQFIPLYNAFARHKGLSLFSQHDADSMGARQLLHFQCRPRTASP